MYFSSFNIFRWMTFSKSITFSIERVNDKYSNGISMDYDAFHELSVILWHVIREYRELN